ncbi:MAG: hypothetical protein A2020_14085 [Lentisphaerae bacterium GWF2_45_14]|nr:MAG: hypothetical protein A2020_14085 [Lentisphaerae bacterium GWF2_45_14]
MRQKPFIKNSESLHKGKWLELKKIHFTDEKGHERSWESVERLRCGGAVVMIAALKPSGRLILIRQFRPPMNSYLMEFPAGLIDDGEDPVLSAERELLEETGYKGKVHRIFAPSCSSPGLTGETVRFCLMHVDENLAENRSPSPAPEEGEHIETFLVSPERLSEFLNSRIEAGDSIDSKLLSYSITLE